MIKFRSPVNDAQLFVQALCLASQPNRPPEAPQEAPVAWQASPSSQSFPAAVYKQVRRPFYFGSRTLSATPSDLKCVRSVWENAVRELLSPGQQQPSPRESWRSGHDRPRRRGSRPSARDPAARSTRGSRDPRGTQREEGGNRSEVKSLQVSSSREGTRSPGARLRPGQPGHILRL